MIYEGLEGLSRFIGGDFNHYPLKLFSEGAFKTKGQGSKLEKIGLNPKPWLNLFIFVVVVVLI